MKIYLVIVVHAKANCLERRQWSRADLKDSTDELRHADNPQNS